MPAYHTCVDSLVLLLLLLLEGAREINTLTHPLTQYGNESLGLRVRRSKQIIVHESGRGGLFPQLLRSFASTLEKTAASGLRITSFPTDCCLTKSATETVPAASGHIQRQAWAPLVPANDHVVEAPTVRITAEAKDEIMQQNRDLERELHCPRRAVQELLR